MSMSGVLLRAAVLFLFCSCLSFPAQAADPAVHTFDCKNCHIPSLSVSQMGEGNICLSCHDKNLNMLLSDGQAGTTNTAFSLLDASNALGGNQAMIAGKGQTSHNWGAPDVQSRAGAVAPSRTLHPEFYSRYGSSAGKVTCSRCHNPHAPRSNEHLLVMGAGSAQQMCLACHSTWNQGVGKSNVTHPVNIDYAASVNANPGKYVASLPEDDGNLHENNQISLFGGKILCGTCHQVHFADSATATADLPENFDVLTMSGGDGRLLRMDGAGRTDTSALCQTCHTYQVHGDGTGEQVGCLVCHGGHANDDPSLPNYYVLRKNATTVKYGTKTDLDYSSPDVQDPAQKSVWWNDGVDGEAAGYCEKCHGDARTIGVGAGDYHVAAAVCSDCHSHSASTSFGANCNGCHAYPPAWGSHAAHMNSAKMPDLAGCKSCHATATHLNEKSEVRFSATDPRLTGAAYSDGEESSRYTSAGGYAAGPAYVTCDSLYCHSNAAPFDKVNAYRNPAWGSAAMTCGSCHGDAAATAEMSSSHGIHAGANAYGFACGKCHAATLTGAATIDHPEKHVDGVKDVSLAGGGSYAADRSCTSVPCHSNGAGGLPNQTPVWGATLGCDGCHNGRLGDALQMTRNAHRRLASDQWIRKYPCGACHAATVDAAGNITGFDKHTNQTVNVAFDAKWSIAGKPAPTYNPATKVCENLYCHSDGTAGSPEIRDFPWNSGEHATCDSCHGHMVNDDCASCHGTNVPQWSAEDQWKRAMPMYANTGAGTARANSHLRHLETEFSCENCHFTTVVGACGSCHGAGVPPGTMTEVGHVNANVHVNKIKDVVFKDGGTYDPITKRCSNTVCHTGDDPQWGDSHNGEVLCLTCHGTTEPDQNDYDAFNGVRGLINMTQWKDRGHGRPLSSGNYTSGNPPSNFPGNPCWYCHDNEVLHRDANNPLRLKIHPQFVARFAKECVYCHMEEKDSECLGCHNSSESLAPQLAALGPPSHLIDHTSFVDGNTGCLTSGCHLPMEESQCLTCHKDNGNAAAPQLVPDKVFVGQSTVPYSLDHNSFRDGLTSCLSARCHTADAHIHNTGAGFWNEEQKGEVRNQYLMMGVCLQCHDDDGNNQCATCHSGEQYKVGFDPGTGFIRGATKVTGFHFGFKHEARHKATGEWPGGMFCWDCHDPHGDNNIFMIQDQVTVSNDGKYGIPQATAAVSFTKAQSGLDYAKNSAPYNGICNVCHMEARQHYRFDYGDGHQSGRACTSCHNHSFSDGHASGQACNECHGSKPIPRHTAFSQPRDCTKCHEGVIKKRMDIMRQFRGKSHHVQDGTVDNKDCYACHWEATELGLINPEYHEGYNYRTHETVANAKNDLVIWEPGRRPERYQYGTTATVFTAEKIGTAEERGEVAKVTQHCLGCHSDQNNDVDVFGDCKTPRQYAWDRSSIAARYADTTTTGWGKYASAPGAAKKAQTKALSAHGNAVANQGGWSATTGEDETLPNTRNGTQNVQCYDCHSSHGSYTEGVTSSYRTFDNSFNGGNLKEAQAGKGGYSITYRAAGKSDGVNPMSPGAAQCFDCHENASATTSGLPWGYQSTFGATAPIIGYRDTPKHGSGSNGNVTRFPFRAGRVTKGGHLKASRPLDNAAADPINGLCTPCHDPHGVSPSLGADRQYAVPLLKGSWLTSPYKDDSPQPVTTTGPSSNKINLDRTVFGNTTSRITQTDEQFGGLCLRCHPKVKLTDGTKKNTAFKSLDRIHETVKGWGNNAEHSFPCAKCHSPHISGLGRLMRTDCLDYNHRGNVVSGGTTGSGSYGSYPNLIYRPLSPCHESQTGAQTNQRWNDTTPW